ncbi:uncharacterized protein LOC102801442 [Saccoglossus kowalevskii]
MASFTESESQQSTLEYSAVVIDTDDEEAKHASIDHHDGKENTILPNSGSGAILPPPGELNYDDTNRTCSFTSGNPFFDFVNTTSDSGETYRYSSLSPSGGRGYCYNKNTLDAWDDDSLSIPSPSLPDIGVNASKVILGGEFGNEEDKTSSATMPYQFPLGIDAGGDGDTEGVTQGTRTQNDDSFDTDLQQLAIIFEEVDVNFLRDRLVSLRNHANRVTIITNELLEEQDDQHSMHPDVNAGGEGNNVTLSGDSFDSVFADVDKVLETLKLEYNLAQLPDANVVFAVLEEHKDPTTRRKATIDFFVKATSNEPMIVETVETTQQLPVGEADHDPLIDDSDWDDRLAIFTHHPFYSDLKVVAKVFPHRDPNEIMAYLEAHHDKDHRRQIVTEELLVLEGVGDSQGSVEGVNKRQRSVVVDDDDDDDVEFIGVISKKVKQSNDNKNDEIIIQDENVTNTETIPDETTAQPVTVLEQDFLTIKGLIPDADPNYIYNMLENMKENPNRVPDLANTMLEKRDYPKLNDVIKEQQRIAKKKQIMGDDFNLVEFIKLFENPTEYFYNEDKLMSDNYSKHVKAKLMNEFPVFTAEFILLVMKKHNNHLTPTLRELEQDQQQEFAKVCNYQSKGRKYKGFQNRKKYRLKPRTVQEPWPEELDEIFFKELKFVQHEREIQNIIDERNVQRNERIEAARASNSLLECGCCYEDELLSEDMVSCPNAHLFCRNCVKRSSQEIIGQGRIDFPCLSPECDSMFTVTVLQKVLLPSVMSNLLKRIQEEEIKKADIPNLETCPFCTFATIMDNPDDKVFKCQNTECLKESCRLCKELNHIPLRCEEVEKENETKKRTFIENQMTEAMLRTCWRCKKKFFKEEGCNKMTCMCGASMCYICRQPIKGYEHFGTAPGQCPPTLDIDHRMFHLKEVASAGEKAKDVYKKDNPEESEVDLKYDPMKDVTKDLETTGGNQRRAFGLGPQGFQFGGIVLPPPHPFQVQRFQGGAGTGVQIIANNTGVRVVQGGMGMIFQGPRPAGNHIAQHAFQFGGNQAAGQVLQDHDGFHMAGQPAQGNGNQIAGLQQGGIRIAGLQQGGIQMAGLQQGGIQMAGLQQGGLQMAGLQQGGIQMAGLQQGGLQMAGLQQGGIQRAVQDNGNQYYTVLYIMKVNSIIKGIQ